MTYDIATYQGLHSWIYKTVYGHRSIYHTQALQDPYLHLRRNGQSDTIKITFIYLFIYLSRHVSLISSTTAIPLGPCVLTAKGEKVK